MSNFSRKGNGKIQLGLDIDGRMILKWILKN